MAIPELLEALLRARGPSGYEAEAARIWRDAAAAYGEVTNDVLGSSYVRVPGGDAPTLAVLGHIDEIGLIVTHVDERGYLAVQRIGGFNVEVVVGQRVTLLTREGEIRGVVARKKADAHGEDKPGLAKIDELHIDIGARDGEEARSLVRPGDAAVMDGDPFELPNGRIVARALDNRLGVSRTFGRGAAMSGAWEQDAAAGFVEELFAAHHNEIYAYLIRMLRDSELAADLTQDAFVKAYRNYNVLEKPENARAWLYQIAHRVALDHIRRQKIVRFLPWTGESHGSAPSTERLVMDAHLSGDLQRALAKIPERQRAALLLAELHDLTGLELAAALGVSHVAARALLTRARENLRQALAVERQADADAEAAADAASAAGTDRRSGTAR